MKQAFPDIYYTRDSHPFQNEVKTRSYMLKSDTGNLLFYSSSHIEEEFEFIDAMGGITAQYLNHRHEASSSCDTVRKRFNAPLICHEFEEQAIAELCEVNRTFSTRHFISPELEAIPTPGHCPGSTCYLLKRDEVSYLFTGDTLFPDSGQWEIYLMSGSSSAHDMIGSLNLLRTLEINVLIPGLYIGEMAWEQVSSARWQQIIDDCIKLAENFSG